MTMTRARPGLQRLNSPLVPMVVAVPLATVFVILRWLDAAHRQLGQFVVAGSLYASPSRVPKNLPVGSGSGYDGQFYYRLALNPFNLSRTAYGIRFDSFSRVERMGYPFLAWVVARGHHSSVPLSLVVVNVAACGVLALAGGILAKSAGRHALWGLVFAGYWGYLWTIGRDLSELTTAALVILGLAAMVRHRPVWSGLAFLGAVLSKETAVLLVGTLALVAIWGRLFQPERELLGAGVGAGSGGHGAESLPVPAAPSPTAKRLTPRRTDLVFAIPLVGFVAWELLLLAVTGHLPIYKSGGENLAFPFVGLVHGFRHYFSIFPTVSSALWFGELAVLILLGIGAARSIRTAPVEFRWLWIVSTLLGLCAATGIWLGDVGFRSLDDTYLMGWVVLLYRPQRIWTWAVLCAGAWFVVFVELVRYI
jgi:hypothetical protein